MSYNQQQGQYYGSPQPQPGAYYPPPGGQPQYYQPQPQPQPIVIQQAPPPKDDHSCCWGCLLALCFCCALDEIC